MDINIFLQIGIVGVALSGLIQFIKTKFITDPNTTKLLTIALAIVVGTLFYVLKSTPLWPTILGILGAASMVYAFLLK